tara:strand:+ start:1057 stop:2301 length:1245 start_codon:yes stop_codon:yes gene_type:complete
MKFRPVRGTHDLLGIDIEKLNKVSYEISKIAEIYNYNKIETPIFESTDLFSKPLGEQSDVVKKEMYTFLDRNNDSLTLRPEYTTPMIRAAISNNLLNNLPCKVFGIGPMFRRERPQKGRYRQFNQINFENFGSDEDFADVELILIAKKIIDKLIPNNKYTLHINSLGESKTLQMYKEELKKYFNKFKKDLSLENQEKILTNPIRILDSKNKKDETIVSSAPLIINFLTKDALLKYENVKKYLTEFKINFKENFSLVRGLDYYCHTVFEFKTDSLGSQDTIIGGGRYDGLIGLLGGKNISGVGWAGGVERIMMLMKNEKKILDIIHLVILDEKYKSYALKAYKKLTDNELSVFWNYKLNLKKSLSKANENNASYAIIIGEDEYKKNKYTLKNLKKGNQKRLELNELINTLKNDKF